MVAVVIIVNLLALLHLMIVTVNKKKNILLTLKPDGDGE